MPFLSVLGLPALGGSGSSTIIGLDMDGPAWVAELDDDVADPYETPDRLMGGGAGRFGLYESLPSIREEDGVSRQLSGRDG